MIVPRAKTETYYAYLAETGFSVGIRLEPNGEFVVALAGCSPMDTFTKKQAKYLLDLRLNTPTNVNVRALGLDSVDEYRFTGLYTGERPKKDLLVPIMDIMRRVANIPFQQQLENLDTLKVGDMVNAGPYSLRVEKVGENTEDDPQENVRQQARHLLTKALVDLLMPNRKRSMSRLRHQVGRYLQTQGYLGGNQQTMEEAIEPISKNAPVPATTASPPAEF